MSDRKHLIVLIISAVGLLAFFFGVLQPRSSEAADLRDRIAQAEAEERSLTDKLLALQQLEASRAELELDVEAMSHYLPKHAHVVRLVRALSKAERLSGVDLQQISPSKPVDHEKVSGAGVMNLSLVLEGGYDRVESFVVQLEDLERALEVTSISFAPVQDPNTRRVSLTATVTAVMYTYDVDKGAAPAPPSEPAGEVSS